MAYVQQGMITYTILTVCMRTHPPPTRAKIPKSGKRGFQGQKLQFPTTAERGTLGQKISIFLQWSPLEKWGFFDSKCPFLGRWEI